MRNKFCSYTVKFMASVVKYGFNNTNYFSFLLFVKNKFHDIRNFQTFIYFLVLGIYSSHKSFLGSFTTSSLDVADIFVPDKL